MKQQRKISVITPSYNQAQFLETTIKSVLSQNYPNLEYIIIDGGSNDGSEDIIRKYASELAYWCCEKDEGQSDAINKGFSKATGEILCWINSDDTLLTGVLHHVNELYSNHNNDSPWWNCGSAELIDANGKLLRNRDVTEVNLEVFAVWNQKWFAQQAVFWNKAMWQAVAPVNRDLYYSMDLDLWMRMYSVSKPVITSQRLAQYRLHADAKCASDQGAILLECSQVIEKNLMVAYRMGRLDESELLSLLKLNKQNYLPFLKELDDLQKKYKSIEKEVWQYRGNKWHRLINRLGKSNKKDFT